MEPHTVRHIRRFCERIESKLDDGKGFFFFGDRGTGKTTLAMLIAQHALKARRTVAIYPVPWLLSQIRSTYEQDAQHSYVGLMERLAAVDLLQLDDMAVASQTDWTLEQLYTIVNRRYEDRRSVVVTAEVDSHEKLGEHIGHRTASRLFEMCETDAALRAGQAPQLRSRGLTAGPCRISPSGEKREPWHGQSQLRSPEFQFSWQPRCVQTGETAWSVPSSSRKAATFSPSSCAMSASPGASSPGVAPAALRQPVAHEPHRDVRVLLHEVLRGRERLHPARVVERRPTGSRGRGSGPRGSSPRRRPAPGPTS